jgi:hypothetical protein
LCSSVPPTGDNPIIDGWSLTVAVQYAAPGTNIWTGVNVMTGICTMTRRPS